MIGVAALFYFLQEDTRYPELFIGFQKTPWNLVLSTYSLFRFHTQKVWKKNPYLLWLMYYQQP